VLTRPVLTRPVLTREVRARQLRVLQVRARQVLNRLVSARQTGAHRVLTHQVLTHQVLARLAQARRGLLPTEPGPRAAPALRARGRPARPGPAPACLVAGPRWPVEPNYPPGACSRRRSSTTPWPPTTDRPGSAGTSHQRAIRSRRSPCRPRQPGTRNRNARSCARWDPRTSAATPEARRTSPSSDV